MLEEIIKAEKIEITDEMAHEEANKEAFRRAVLKELVENFRELDDGKNDDRLS